MGDLTRNFSRHEFACQCGCGFDTVDVGLVGILQLDVRDHFHSAVTISGPNRCHKRNAQTPGAAENSLHTVGKAADIKVAGITPRQIYDHLDNLYPDSLELGLYNNRVHVGVSTRRKRWAENANPKL